MLASRLAAWPFRTWPHLQRPQTCAQLRCFAASTTHRTPAAHSNGRGAALANHGAFMGIVTTQSSEAATMDQLIAKIVPEAQGKPLRANATPSLLALLVTPLFAKHANDPNLALKVLERFHANPSSSKPLDSLTAVVDRLPVSANSVSGAEGIAYALVTDPLQSHAASLVPMQPNVTKPGSVSFDFSTGPRHITAQMPLAQTIFMTGVPSTLVHTRYQFDPLTGQLRRQSSQSLESATIPLPDSHTEGFVTLRVPMIPLTLPRRVESSMGNIVRKLSIAQPTAEKDDASTAETIPASQELEAAVSGYFALNDIGPEAVEVWALILPDHKGAGSNSFLKALRTLTSESLEQIWLGHEEVVPTRNMQLDNLLPSLTAGARLCKVLSGGGGWGKKAGLLSLDPDAQYSTRDLRGNEGWEFTFEGDTAEEMMAAGRRQALGEVVKPGESIMFFLANRRDMVDTMMRDASDPSPLSSHEGQIVLGALPVSTESTATSARQAVTHYSGRFGALCEGGMALTIVKNDKQGKHVTRTKTDVPHARLTIDCFDTRSTQTTGTAKNYG